MIIPICIVIVITILLIMIDYGNYMEELEGV